MMHDAFLDAIRESPDDDAPRLVYADWLADNGEAERGEFIRLQVAAAKGDRRAEARAGNLLEDHPAWRGEAIDGVTLEPPERGFIQSASIRFGDWSRDIRGKAARLFAHPLTRLCLLDATLPRLRSFLKCPAVRHLRELDIPNYEERPLRAGLGRALAAADLPHLRRLEIGDHELGDKGFKILLDAGRLASLNMLHVAGNGLTGKSIQRMADGPCRMLTELWIDENPIGPAGSRAIAGSMAFSLLSEVHFSYCELGDEGVAALAASGHLKALHDLDLHTNGIGPEGAAALGASSAFPFLRELQLTNNPLTPAGAAALANGPLLHPVRDLWLIGTVIGAEGMAALAQEGALPNLREWHSSEGRIGDEGLIAFGRGRFPALEEMFLRADRFSARAVRAFLAGRFIPQMRKIDLPANELDDDAARAFADCDALEDLETLDLGGNAIGDAGAVAMAESPHLDGVRSLTLGGNPIGERGKAALRERFGKSVKGLD